MIPSQDAKSSVSEVTDIITMTDSACVTAGMGRGSQMIGNPFDLRMRPSMHLKQGSTLYNFIQLLNPFRDESHCHA